MKKVGILFIGVACLFTLFSQDKLFVHSNNKSVLGVLLSAIDSLNFGNNQTELNIHMQDGSQSTFTLSAIDSLNFGNVSDTVRITYSGTSAVIENPLKGLGVAITQTGADVVVVSTLDQNEVTYVLSGSTTDGSFKIYSNYRLGLLLKGLNITNSDGPAINIQSSKKISVYLANGTTNSLTDGTTYATSTEDQKAAFFSEGQLWFDGTGILTVKSNSKHGICSDDYIQINNGNITVSGAAKDGIHSKDYFRMTGGTLSVNATSDGIECEAGHVLISGGKITTVNAAADTKGIASDSTMIISGGIINMTVNGNQAKGLKSKQAMTLSGGTITINTAGGPVLSALGSGYDPSYCTAIKSNTDLTVSGANITIISTGAAGKGISADGNLTMTSGTVNVTTSGGGSTYTNSLGVLDAYASSCFEADGSIHVLGGSLTAVCSGVASKGISADGALSFGDASNSPTVKVTNTGTRLLVSGTSGSSTADFTTPKCIKSDGVMTINNGTFTLSVSNPGSSCLNSDSTLFVMGGTLGLTVGGTQSKGIKATKDITLNGGTFTINTSGAVELETSGSGYDPAYCAAIKGDAVVNVGGSTITIVSSGAAGKGVSSDTDINMTSGSLNITCSGSGTTYKNTSGTTDSYSAACLTADGNIHIIGGTLTTLSSGAGGKGLKADGTITIGDSGNSPILNIKTTGSRFLVSGTDYCHPKTIVSSGAITVNNGTNTISSTDDGIHSDAAITIAGGTNTISAVSTIAGVGEGVEAPVITFNGGTTNINASNDGINATYGTVSGGTESNDGSYLYINGGIVIVAGSDAIDSNGNIVINGGTTIVNGPSSGVEEGIDFNGTFNMNGGLLISAGSNSSMSKAMNTTSTQPGMFIKSATLIASTSLLHIQNASGTDMLSFKPENGGYYFYFSSAALIKGAVYKIYSGGSYSGGSFVGATTGFGLYSGGTYSTTGATLKSTTTLSTTSTVNTITF